MNINSIRMEIGIERRIIIPPILFSLTPIIVPINAIAPVLDKGMPKAPAGTEEKRNTNIKPSIRYIIPPRALKINPTFRVLLFPFLEGVNKRIPISSKDNPIMM